MPERSDSVESFDEFFGVSKTDDDRKKSPIKSKQNDTTISTMVKTQPLIERPRTPSTPEERRLPTPKTKRKSYHPNNYNQFLCFSISEIK
jgi:hypothetical protein